MMEGYGRGFEDGLESALMIVKKAGSVDEAVRRLEQLLGLIKERKFEALERELGSSVVLK